MAYPPPPPELEKRDLRLPDLRDMQQALLHCYTWMHLSRITDDRFLDLFRQGRARGTVTGGQGNEGLVVPIALLANKKIDVVAFSHRGFGGKLIWSRHLSEHACQYLANGGSPTRGREGNVHYGDPDNRGYPMISHLGAMPLNVLGGVDSQRRRGIEAVGIAFIGDGASSTGDVHECMNLASLLKIPLIIVIENNGYAYSTPVSEQYATPGLAGRAAGYGMEAITIDATDAEATLLAFAEAIEKARRDCMPMLVEARTLRLRGHAAYDTCHYIPSKLLDEWKEKDPLHRLRSRLAGEGLEAEIQRREELMNDFLEKSLEAAIAQPPVAADGLSADTFARATISIPWRAGDPGMEKLTMAQALQRAHRKILAEFPESIVIGQDIAFYGGAFKVTEDLFAEFGRKRVLNMPVAESGIVGYATGLALNGHRPIVEFQFADFATDAITQITLNAATYYFRSGAKVPLVLRLPCGGGLTFGSFHSQELETIFLHMPGIKALYPSTPQDAFNALLAAFEDDNPVLLFEHKGLYRRFKQEVMFDPNYKEIWHPRLVLKGDYATVISYGEMLLETAEACRYLQKDYEIDFDLFDLRALSPLDLTAIEQSLRRTRRLIVVHEGRRNIGFGAELVSRLTESFFFEMDAPPLRIASADTPVPFAPELEKEYRPSRNTIIARILAWMETAV